MYLIVQRIVIKRKSGQFGIAGLRNQQIPLKYNKIKNRLHRLYNRRSVIFPCRHFFPAWIQRSWIMCAVSSPRIDAITADSLFSGRCNDALMRFQPYKTPA